MDDLLLGADAERVGDPQRDAVDHETQVRVHRADRARQLKRLFDGLPLVRSLATMPGNEPAGRTAMPSALTRASTSGPSGTRINTKFATEGHAKTPEISASP